MAEARSQIPTKKATKSQTWSKAQLAQASNPNSRLSGTVRFENLPGELRNTIYGFALVADGPIEICRPVDKVATETKARDYKELWGVELPPGQRLVHKFAAIVRKQQGKTARKLNFRDISALSLLLVNKNIAAEARPLLYARNTFHFESLKAFYAFYESAYSNIPLLENIELVDIPDSHRFYAPLGHTQRLSRVSVNLKAGGIGRRELLAGINFHNTWNLLLRCRCKTCSNNRYSSPDQIQEQGEGYIAITSEQQRRRLEAVSIRVGDFDICLSQKPEDEPETENDTTTAKARLKRDLLRHAEAEIKRNLCRARGIRFSMANVPERALVQQL